MSLGGTMKLTNHAKRRANSRRISESTIELVMRIGRVSYSKGAIFFWLGKKEIKRFIKIIPDITKYEGIVVVCGYDGIVLTTYKNRNFNKKFKWN